jgi:small subunit ribosomal protein S8
MGMTDPIADMLTRIRNANMVKHKTVEIPASKLKLEIARLLNDEGFIPGLPPLRRALGQRSRFS